MPRLTLSRIWLREEFTGAQTYLAKSFSWFMYLLLESFASLLDHFCIFSCVKCFCIFQATATGTGRQHQNPPACCSLRRSNLQAEKKPKRNTYHFLIKSVSVNCVVKYLPQTQHPKQQNPLLVSCANFGATIIYGHQHY